MKPNTLAKEFPMVIMFPKPLLGTKDQVHKQWRTIANQAIDTGSFVDVLGQYGSVDCDTTDARFLTMGPLWDEVEYFHLYLVIESIFDITLERIGTKPLDYEAWYHATRTLIVNNLSLDWFCISLLAGQRWFPKSDAYEKERIELNAIIMRKLLSYWDWLCEHTEKFRSPDYRIPDIPDWLAWGVVFRALAHELDCPEELFKSQITMDAEEARAHFTALVRPHLDDGAE